MMKNLSFEFNLAYEDGVQIDRFDPFLDSCSKWKVHDLLLRILLVCKGKFVASIIDRLTYLTSCEKAKYT